MPTCKTVYVVLGMVLGVAGLIYHSGELLILSPAFLGSAAVQAWLGRRSAGIPRPAPGPRGLLVGKF